MMATTAAEPIGVTMSAPEPVTVPSDEPQYDFGFSDFLEREFSFGADSKRPVCEAFRKGFCPNNPCPDKHHLKSNYQNLVCKHWLRGLCKKGNGCEFLHEYNLREMPECIQYARYGLCMNGSECLYRHVDPIYKQPPCQHYMRGFCPLGPRCGARHEKIEKICQFYINGFCPDGKNCAEGAHPAWKEQDAMEKPRVKFIPSEEEQAERIEQAKAQMQKDDEEDEKRFLDRGTYNQQKMQSRGRGRRGFGRSRRGGDRGDRY